MNETTTTLAMEAEENTDVPPARIVLGMALFLIVLVTVVGNALVLAAVAREKRLQTAFNVFIVNLALTDVSVGLVAGFFAVFNILQTWPFGRVLCGIWIFCDFGMTLASIFTLLAISVHRYWSVYWGFQYRLHNSRRKAVIATVLIWTVMLLLWVPTFTVDRLQNDHQDGQCFYDPAKNKVFVAIVAIVGYHGSTAVMLFCYVKVFLFIRRRSQESPFRINYEVGQSTESKTESNQPPPVDPVLHDVTRSTDVTLDDDSDATVSKQKGQGTTKAEGKDTGSRPAHCGLQTAEDKVRGQAEVHGGGGRGKGDGQADGQSRDLHKAVEGEESLLTPSQSGVRVSVEARTNQAFEDDDQNSPAFRNPTTQQTDVPQETDTSNFVLQSASATGQDEERLKIATVALQNKESKSQLVSPQALQRARSTLKKATPPRDEVTTKLQEDITGLHSSGVSQDPARSSDGDSERQKSCRVKTKSKMSTNALYTDMNVPREDSQDPTSSDGDSEHQRPCRMNPKNTMTMNIADKNIANAANKQMRREQKLFLTLTYIMVGYLVCWMPFHVSFDIMAVDRSLVPHWFYDVTYWLAYCNSAINPFLYTFSNSDFRRAFKKMFRMS